MRPLLLALALAQPLPFSTGWTDTGLIRADDDWSGVPGVEARRGDAMVAAPGTDPRSVMADGAATPPDVQANEADPRAFGLAAGVAEFELPNPVVALKGSATADAPHLVLSLDTRGHADVRVAYALRDVDAAVNGDAAQAVALQYRIGATGPFANVPGGYVADATTGPGQATKVTPVGATLPAATADRPLVQVRVLTADADGVDEWVGVDDIAVTGTPCGGAGAAPCPGATPDRPDAPSPGRPAPPRPAPHADTKPPTIRALAVSPNRVRRGGAARLTVRVSENATLLLRTETVRCAAGATCGRAPARPWRVRVRGGRSRLRFRPRVGRRPAPRGGYRLVAIAVDLAGNRSARRGARFAIVRPRERSSRRRG